MPGAVWYGMAAVLASVIQEQLEDPTVDAAAHAEWAATLWYLREAVAAGAPGTLDHQVADLDQALRGIYAACGGWTPGPLLLNTRRLFVGRYQAIYRFPLPRPEPPLGGC